LFTFPSDSCYAWVTSGGLDDWRWARWWGSAEPYDPRELSCTNCCP
jgi:hypothetical protein